MHILHYSKLRKNVHVTQSQNVPLSCLSRPLADRLAEAAYRDILGLSYARAFSAAWSTARLWVGSNQNGLLQKKILVSFFSKSESDFRSLKLGFQKWLALLSTTYLYQKLKRKRKNISSYPFLKHNCKTPTHSHTNTDS